MDGASSARLSCWPYSAGASGSTVRRSIYRRFVISGAGRCRCCRQPSPSISCSARSRWRGCQNSTFATGFPSSRKLARFRWLWAFSVGRLRPSRGSCLRQHSLAAPAGLRWVRPPSTPSSRRGSSGRGPRRWRWPITAQASAACCSRRFGLPPSAHGAFSPRQRSSASW